MIEEHFKFMKEPPPTLFIYTDGACHFNGQKKARAGIGVHCQHFDISEKFPYENPTNQRAELFAILTALELIVENKLHQKYEEINLYTDSLYSINCCTKWIHSWIKSNWKKPIKNREFIEPVFKLLQDNPKIKLFHVKAHTGRSDIHSVGNQKADELAGKGC